jgi:hypothetical protein
MTGTVKCRVCKTRTRHAILRDDCPEYRDKAEEDDHGSTFQRPRTLAEASDEELTKLARHLVYEVTDRVMKPVPLGDLTMQECYVVLDAFKQIADNHDLWGDEPNQRLDRLTICSARHPTPP